MEATKEKMTQNQAYEKRKALLNWFKRYTFGNCSDIEQIVVTRDTVDNFHDNAGSLVWRPEESPSGCKVYGGFGIVVVDAGEFRFVYAD
jgi:hypothetical protein